MYQKVLVRNKRGGKEKWIPGTVVKITGPSTYIIRMAGNVRRFVHADHITCYDALENPMSDRPDGNTEIAYGKNDNSPVTSVPVASAFSKEGTSDNVTSQVLVNYPQKPIYSTPPKITVGGHPEVDPVSVVPPFNPGRVVPPLEVSTGSVGSPCKVSRAGRPIKSPQRLDL